MERLKQKRKTQRSQVSKVLSEIDAAVEREVLAEEELRILLARLNTIHGQLNATAAAIEPLLTDGEAELEYARTSEYNDRVIACSARLSFKITIASADVKLPKLELLRFNGDSLQWQPFWEQFDQVVHNNRELSPTDKFNYLRAALYEEAAAAIAGLPATASCYEDTWDVFKTRFGDGKRLIDDRMIKLLERQRIRSSLDVRGLRHIRGLRSLRVSEETFSTLLHPLVLRLLPEDLALAYHRTAVRDEEHRRLSTKSAALSSNNSDQDRAYVFYTKRTCKVVDKQRDGSSTPKTNRQPGLQEYAFCKSSNHDTEPEVCSEILSLTEKRQILQKAGRCFKCTKRNHLAKKCRSKIACSECQGRHATFICDPEFLSRSSENQETPIKSKDSTSPVTLQAAVTDKAKTMGLLQTATVWSSEAKSATAQEKAAHTEAQDDVGRLKKALSTSNKKTEVKFKMLLEQSSDHEKEVSVLQSQPEEKFQLLKSAQHALDSNCTQMEETTRELAARKAAAEAQIAGLIEYIATR
ncbi:hypothetical protein HPB47_022293 [Ixodes persulcatus]|uniref:Uncharacterized protein n=1 Tax=Ixodes persulcatus TaxID=34615 RepID=A0AC60QA28_IXOPE|nr:hypothetical protein HPB47_022293 [Ixodes persulcatus]